VKREKKIYKMSSKKSTKKSGPTSTQSILSPAKQMKQLGLVQTQDHYQVNEVADSRDYQQFCNDVKEHQEYKKGAAHFFARCKQIRSPASGGYGVVNFVLLQDTKELVVVKAVRDCPRREKELYWLWRLREQENFIKLVTFFRSAKLPPSEWRTVDSTTESVWEYQGQLYIVTPYYPYSLENVLYPPTTTTTTKKNKKKLRDEDVERATIAILNEQENENSDDEDGSKSSSSSTAEEDVDSEEEK
jgi:hypothetical protein